MDAALSVDPLLQYKFGQGGRKCKRIEDILWQDDLQLGVYLLLAGGLVGCLNACIATGVPISIRYGPLHSRTPAYSV